MKIKIVVIFFCLMPSIAGAFTIEKAYEYCKPYAQNGFNLSPQAMGQSLTCKVYFTSIFDTATLNCQAFKIIGESGVSVPDIIKGLNSGSLPSPNALIQEFLNEAEANPQIWDNPVQLITSGIIQRYDCK
jgi:hypothetical protein